MPMPDPMHMLVTNIRLFVCFAMLRPVAIWRAPAVQGGGGGKVRYLTNTNVETKPTHAERVTNGDRTTVEVDLLVRQAKLLNAIDSLGCKRLVDLEKVDIICRKAGLGEHLGDGERRANAHDAWGNAGGASGNKLANDRETETLGNRTPRKKDSSGAIRYLGCIASMGRPVFLERGLELGEALRSDTVAYSVIGRDYDLLNLLRLGVHPVHLQWHNLVTEAASLGGSRSFLERLCGKGVLLCTSNPVVRRDIFRSYAHGKKAVFCILIGKNSFRPAIGQ